MSITGRVGPEGCERASGAGISGKRAEKKAHGYGMKNEEPWLLGRSRPGHRPRKPNRWRLGFVEPGGEREKP